MLSKRIIMIIMMVMNFMLIGSIDGQEELTTILNFNESLTVKNESLIVNNESLTLNNESLTLNNESVLLSLSSSEPPIGLGQQAPNDFDPSTMADTISIYIENTCIKEAKQLMSNRSFDNPIQKCHCEGILAKRCIEKSCISEAFKSFNICIETFDYQKVLYCEPLLVTDDGWPANRSDEVSYCENRPFGPSPNLAESGFPIIALAIITIGIIILIVCLLYFTNFCGHISGLSLGTTAATTATKRQIFTNDDQQQQQQQL